LILNKIELDVVLASLLLFSSALRYREDVRDDNLLLIFGSKACKRISKLLNYYYVIIMTSLYGLATGLRTGDEGQQSVTRVYFVLWAGLTGFKQHCVDVEELMTSSEGKTVRVSSEF